MSTTHVATPAAPTPATPARTSRDLGVCPIGPGSVIGGFRIERTLGCGGMGVAYAASQLTDGHQVAQETQGAPVTQVALKVMSGRHANDLVMRARFSREGEVTAALTSRHVVRVLGRGEHEGLLWMASELIPGGDLAEALRTMGTPPAAVAIDLVAQVAEGIADAHAAGFVHRDIKPANVLLQMKQGRMTAYVTDFGIARTAHSELTETAAMLGTATCMAPELHHGVEASVASDVYALGCLLWAVLIGEVPYAWSTGDYQLMSAHIGAPVPSVVPVDARAVAVNAVLAKAMAKEPAQRFTSADEFRNAVLAIRTASGSSTRRHRPARPSGA